VWLCNVPGTAHHGEEWLNFRMRVWFLRRKNHTLILKFNAKSSITRV